MVIVEDGQGNWPPFLDTNNTPVLYDSDLVMTQYLSIIGYNLTGEFFHPDEISAQNLVFVANQPSALSSLI